MNQARRGGLDEVAADRAVDEEVDTLSLDVGPLEQSLGRHRRRSARAHARLLEAARPDAGELLERAGGHAEPLQRGGQRVVDLRRRDPHGGVDVRDVNQGDVVEQVPHAGAPIEDGAGRQDAPKFAPASRAEDNPAVIRHRQAQRARSPLAASIALCLLAFGLTLHAQSSAPVAQQLSRSPRRQPRPAGVAGRAREPARALRHRCSTPASIACARARRGRRPPRCSASRSLSCLMRRPSVRSPPSLRGATTAEAEARAATDALRGGSRSRERAPTPPRAADASWAERAGLLRWLASRVLVRRALQGATIERARPRACAHRLPERARGRRRRRRAAQTGSSAEGEQLVVHRGGACSPGAAEATADVEQRAAGDGAREREGARDDRDGSHR